MHADASSTDTIARWREVRDLAKFDRMVDFGRALPKLRQRLRHDLARRGLPREKVLAVIVSMLDSTRARIGNPEYARQNSFGLSTLRNRHVEFVRDGRALLRFRGKGGVRHEIVVDDKRLARLVRQCQELPGQQLFQYIDDDGQRCPVGSGEVNDYLREAMGGEFTAKDFRTWGATTRTVVLLSRTPLPRTPDRARVQGAGSPASSGGLRRSCTTRPRFAASRTSTRQYSKRGAVDTCSAS